MEWLAALRQLMLKRLAHDQLLIDFDLPCDQCRYNLRGLHQNGRCPECGYAIAESVAASKSWLDNLLWSDARAALPLTLGLLAGINTLYFLFVWAMELENFIPAVIGFATIWALLFCFSIWCLLTSRRESRRTKHGVRWSLIQAFCTFAGVVLNIAAALLIQILR